jgi:hypothetical protein
MDKPVAPSPKIFEQGLFCKKLTFFPLIRFISLFLRISYPKLILIYQPPMRRDGDKRTPLRAALN